MSNNNLISSRGEGFEKWYIDNPLTPDEQDFVDALPRSAQNGDYWQTAAIGFWAGCEHGRTEVETEYREVVKALQIIANPVGYLVGLCEEDGTQPDGAAINRLADDAGWLRANAAAALEKLEPLSKEKL